MEKIPQEQLLKRYHSLLKTLQDAIFSEQSADAIRKACVLREIEQSVSVVAKLTGRVLLGYLRPELFALEIQKETGMDMQKAQLIAQDLDAEIFSAVRLELKKLYPPTIQTPTVQTWRSESRSMNYESRKTAEPPAKPKYVIPIPEKFLRQSADATKPNMARPAESGDVGFPTTGTLSDSTGSPQRQIAKEETGGQAAEARPHASPGLQQREPAVAPDQAQKQISKQPAEFSERRPGLEERKTGESRQSPIPPPAPTLKANEAPSFKPIVPLPTFIQTQFRTTQVNSQKSAGNVASPGLQQRESPATPDQAQRQISQQQTKTQQTEAGTQESSLANDPQIKNLISKFTSSSTQKPKPPAESPYREKV